MTVLQALLDIAARGDERALKRAYAQALRQARPDDDPVAFQALQSAYEKALAWCRQVAADSSTAAPASASAAQPTLETRPVASPRQAAAPTRAADAPQNAVPIDAHAACEALLAQAERADPEVFVTYVRTLRSAWSLDLSAAVGAQVLRALDEKRAPMSLEASAALSEAFGWNDVGSGLPAYTLQRLADHAFQAWLQLPAQAQTRAELIKNRGGGWVEPETATLRLHQLQQPSTRWRNLCAALPYGAPRQALALLYALGEDPHLPAPPGIDRDQARFWRSVAVSPLSRDAIHLLLLRSLVVGVSLATGIFLLYVLPNRFSPSAPLPLQPATLLVAVGLLGPPLAAVAFTGLRLLIAWQAAPEVAHAPRRWLRWLAVPALCTATAIAAFVAYQSRATLSPRILMLLLVLVVMASWTALITAWHRLQGRRGKPANLSDRLSLPMMFATVTVAPALFAALVMWSIDAFRHRPSAREEPPV